MKTLTLYPRSEREDSPPMWHDLYAVQAALRQIAQGKPLTKLGLWMSISTKLQYAELELEIPLRNDRTQELSIQLRNVEAAKLWEELKKMSPEVFGGINPLSGQQAVPDLFIVDAMMSDIAEQLEEKWPLEDFDDDEE